MGTEYTYFELPLHTLAKLLTVLALNILVPLQRGHKFCANKVNLQIGSTTGLHKRQV